MATYNNIKKIKIGDNIFNLYDSGNSGGTITSVKTTAGAHTAVNVTSGAANFNVPTKTSHLTNDSGFVTTDEKLKVEELSNNTTYSLILSGGSSIAASKNVDSDFKYVYMKNDTGTGSAKLTLGNSTASGTAGNKQGQLILYGSTAYAHTIVGAPTSNRTITLPNATGTIALTSDIPTVPTKTSQLTNDSGFITSYTDYDEKVKVSALTSGTSYYPILAAAANTASRQIDSTLQGFKYQSTAGTTSTIGTATLTLGNSTASGTANNEQGVIRIYGTTTYRNDLKALDGYPEGNYTIYLPRYKAVTYLTCTSTTNAVGGATTAPVYVDNSGCIQAVTSIPYSLLTGTPTIPTIKLNNTSTTSPSFYAPTGAGSSGQYLKSNGSGAPSWTNFPTIPTITLNGSATTSPSFYAPTSAGTSGYVLKSNGSGAPSWGSAILTDKKLEVAEVTTNTIYYPIVGTGASANTRQYDTTGFKYSSVTGTSSTMGYARITLGNNTPSGTAGNKVGQIQIYGRNNNHITFEMPDVETSTNCYLPNKTGTIALTSDLSNYLPLSGGTMTGPITMAHGISNAIYGTFQDGSSALPMLSMTYGDSTVENYIALGATNNNIPVGIYGSNVYLTNGGSLTLQGNLTINGHETPIGDVVPANKTQNIATGTSWATTGCSVSLTQGVWVVVGSIEYAANATGRRGVEIYANGHMTHTQVNVAAGSNATTRLVTTGILEISAASMNVYIYGYQNSGSSLSQTTYMRAVRIR